ncbi:MAG: hypothetical protein KKA79_05230 [Nanoarchaeota archaeon]|nr:hypothetical protein [Nanoarchaeota archaeon]
MRKRQQKDLGHCSGEKPFSRCGNRIQSKDVQVNMGPRSKKIYKLTRGLFKYRLTSEEETERTNEEISPTLREEDFYKPFANCLKTDLGEYIEAVALGGSYLGKRWGTPDVIGIYKPLKRDVIKFEPEIISTDTEGTRVMNSV